MNIFDQKQQLGFKKNLQIAGDTRQFVIADGKGGVTDVDLLCIWSRDTMKTNPIATAVGVFFADIMATFLEYDLATKGVRIPQEGEFLESPAYVKYEVVGQERGSGIVTLSLMRRTPRE